MKCKCLIFGLVLLVALLATGVVLAAVEADYDLSWWTVDGGGGTSHGGDYTLSGTLGQPDAGTPVSGGEYTLASGFWHGNTTATIEMKIFLPLIVR